MRSQAQEKWQEQQVPLKSSWHFATVTCWPGHPVWINKTPLPIPTKYPEPATKGSLWRLGALDLRHRGDNCSIPSDSTSFESAPYKLWERNVTQWPAWESAFPGTAVVTDLHGGKLQTQFSYICFQLICFQSIPFSWGQNPLRNNKVKKPGTCTHQEKGISAGITCMKNCVHETVWKKKKEKKCILVLVGRVDNCNWSQLWVCKLPMKKCDRELCLPTSSPYLCNQIISELLEAEICKEDWLHAKRKSPGKSQDLNNRNTGSAAWDTVSCVDVLRAGWLLPLPGRSVCKQKFVFRLIRFCCHFICMLYSKSSPDRMGQEGKKIIYIYIVINSNNF